MKLALIAALIAFPAVYSPDAEANDIHADLAAKMYELDPEIRSMTEEVLRRKNEDYADVALKNQTKRGEMFTHARVEVTGVMSNDDTRKYDPDLFSAYIKPSFSVKETGLKGLILGPINDALRKIFPPIENGEDANDLRRDIQEFEAAASGVTTDRARAKLEPYRNAEINELVAHSWGCELIYAAILNGEIRPPKKLILVGVPDDDRRKWAMLAERTGTEVHWARADNDAVALDMGVQRALKSAASVDFKAKWDSLCANIQTKGSCHAHDRKSKPVVYERIGRIPGLDGHARTEYYDKLKLSKVLKGTAAHLVEIQDSKLAAELDQVKNYALAEAEVEARGLVAQAREQAKIAQSDHDERLKNAMGDLTYRSCSNPGSVSQEELNSLPQPYNENFYVSKLPSGVENCNSVYLYLAQGGRDAGKLGRMSVPEMHIVPSIPSIPSIPTRPIDGSVPNPPFSSVLPDLKMFAIAACLGPEQVQMDYYLYRTYDYSSSGYDGNRARQLSSDLENCPRQIFNQLISTIRSGQGLTINRQWVRSNVAANTSRAVTPPGYINPPPDYDPCRAHGNLRCP